MNLPVPDFVPVPNPEILLTMSIVLLIVGICLVCIGGLLFFLRKRKGKKTIIPWICIGAGILLVTNHGIQLIFNFLEV